MKNLIRRCGIVGFAFFFVKGLLWLTLPAAIVAYRGCGQERAELVAEGHDAPPAIIAEARSDEYQRPVTD